jgi:excisionase family DNA binding protein
MSVLPIRFSGARCEISFKINELFKINRVGMENAINTRKVLYKRWKDMIRDLEDTVMTTREACRYLRISRPTYLKHLYKGKIRGVKVGKGWKVLKSELDRFLKGDYDYPTYQPAVLAVSQNKPMR